MCALSNQLWRKLQDCLSCEASEMKVPGDLANPTNSRHYFHLPSTLPQAVSRMHCSKSQSSASAPPLQLPTVQGAFTSTISKSTNPLPLFRAQKRQISRAISVSVKRAWQAPASQPDVPTRTPKPQTASTTLVSPSHAYPWL